MALQTNPGAFFEIGAGSTLPVASVPAAGAVTLDAANEAVIFLGHIVTSDGGSHTLDTTGSSSIGWRTSTVTFANAGTTVKVGLASVLTTAGPPGRANNAADVITFDVNAAPVGGGGGITANAWQTTVPTAGTKAVANGDYIALAIQMTARAGVDSVVVSTSAAGGPAHRTLVTAFVGASYGAQNAMPNAIITFSDGALGYFYGTEIFSTQNTRTWNSGGATKEYGQLFNFPFPMKIVGLWGFVDPDNDFDAVLYSDVLGTPVAEKTISIDANTVAAAAARKFYVMFPAPYVYSANTNIGAVFKPGASNISAYYKTLASATHRVSDPWGTSGYGISRAAGAFADANSSLDHYYIGLLVGGFEHGVWPSGHLGV
jgi:hypothetical protein